MKTFISFLFVFSTISLFANPWELRARFATTPPEGYFIFIVPLNDITHYGYDYFPVGPGSTFPDPLLYTKNIVTADFNSTDGTDGAFITANTQFIF